MRGLENSGKELEAGIIKQQIDDEFEKAYHDYAAWEQMFSVLDLRRKMVESEVKIAKDIQAMMTAEDGYELVAQIFAAIIRIVNKFELGPKVLKAFQYEFTKIIGDEPIGENQAGSGDIIDSE